MKTKFDFPVSKWQTQPAIFIGNLTVHLDIKKYSDGSYKSFDIDYIEWEGNSIGALIEAISPDCYEEIQDAAKAHIETLFPEPKATEDEKYTNLKEVTSY